MKKKLMLVVTAVCIAVVFSSCGKAPQAEIDAANAAIEAAKAAGADVYVAEDFAALQDSMNAVNENVEAQNAKLFKNFSKVTEQLVVVNQMAVETQAKAETRKAEVKLEIEALQAEVSSILLENNDLVTKAPKGKEGAAALEAIKSDISLIETSVGEVATLVANDNLIPALDKVKAAKEKAVAINTELNEVIAKYAKSRR
ncbi:hypothetical protein [Gaoshiqia sediminis]|uniref:DUF4398 domain-containing protein n=1 Tax=Gaoshiqia sediminis TaxID=2986998 RepID=A0AA41YBZ5_9BACT|nr:hypothetical protein [Gaoshiqia sediminis]MCW0483385.1 hypothetical protein [Gaoshiqia sediminis]